MFKPNPKVLVEISQESWKFSEVSQQCSGKGSNDSQNPEGAYSRIQSQTISCSKRSVQNPSDDQVFVKLVK